MSAIRTSPALVQAILGDNYGLLLSGSLPDLTPFIVAANIMTNSVVYWSTKVKRGQWAIQDGGAYPTGVNSQAEVIERWLAAHFYSNMDQIWSQKTTAGASASFQGQTASFLESSKYGQFALRMDMSGALEAIDKRKFASGGWLGSPQGACCWWQPIWDYCGSYPE